MSCLVTLKEKGFKLTPQRRLIADIIHDAHTHITAEDIIARVQEKMPGVNKSTIYRTLDLLTENGCVYRSEVGDQHIYHHAEEAHHHHLVCRLCGKTIVCEENIFESVEEIVNEKYGFKPDIKHLVMTGICRECQLKK